MASSNNSTPCHFIFALQTASPCSRRCFAKAFHFDIRAVVSFNYICECARVCAWNLNMLEIDNSDRLYLTDHHNMCKAPIRNHESKLKGKKINYFERYVMKLFAAFPCTYSHAEQIRIDAAAADDEFSTHSDSRQQFLLLFLVFNFSILFALQFRKENHVLRTDVWSFDMLVSGCQEWCFSLLHLWYWRDRIA